MDVLDLSPDNVYVEEKSKNAKMIASTLKTPDFQTQIFLVA